MVTDLNKTRAAAQAVLEYLDTFKSLDHTERIAVLSAAIVHYIKDLSEINQYKATIDVCREITTLVRDRDVD